MTVLNSLINRSGEGFILEPFPLFMLSPFKLSPLLFLRVLTVSFHHGTLELVGPIFFSYDFKSPIHISPFDP